MPVGMVVKPVTNTTDKIFVGGASRSGTTVLARSLGLHSQLYAVGEMHFLSALVDVDQLENDIDAAKAQKILAKLYAREELSILRDDVTETHQQLADDLLKAHRITTYANLFEIFLNDVAQRHSAKIPVEDTPRNIFYASLLLELYPESRFIEIVRDPRAVLHSQRKRWKIRYSEVQGTRAPLQHTLSKMVNYHAITMSHLWRSAVRVGLQLEKHPRFHSIRYEDLVSNPDTVLKEVCVFLNINFEKAIINAPHTTSSTHKIDESTGGFYASALNSWRKDLHKGDLGICEYMTSAVAAQRGYVRSEQKLCCMSVCLQMFKFPFHVLSILLVNPHQVVIQLKSLTEGISRMTKRKKEKDGIKVER